MREESKQWLKLLNYKDNPGFDKSWSQFKSLLPKFVDVEDRDQSKPDTSKLPQSSP